MNSIINQVQLLGNIGQTPELKTFSGDKKLIRFSLATNESYRSADGQKVDKTQWHTVLAWGKLAESIGKYAAKGNKVAVKGKLQHSQYEKDGETRYRTEIVAQEFMVLTPKEG